MKILVDKVKPKILVDKVKPKIVVDERPAASGRSSSPRTSKRMSSSKKPTGGGKGTGRRGGDRRSSEFQRQYNRKLDAAGGGVTAYFAPQTAPDAYLKDLAVVEAKKALALANAQQQDAKRRKVDSDTSMADAMHFLGNDGKKRQSLESDIEVMQAKLAVACARRDKAAIDEAIEAAGKKSTQAAAAYDEAIEVAKAAQEKKRKSAASEFREKQAAAKKLLQRQQNNKDRQTDGRTDGRERGQ